MNLSVYSIHIYSITLAFLLYRCEGEGEQNSLNMGKVSIVGILTSVIVTSFSYRYAKRRVDESESLTLDSIRHSLIRQEDSIIRSLLERTQYCYNADTYDHGAFTVDGFQGSLVEFMVRETEKLHAQVI